MNPRPSGYESLDKPPANAVSSLLVAPSAVALEDQAARVPPALMSFGAGLRDGVYAMRSTLHRTPPTPKAREMTLNAGRPSGGTAWRGQASSNLGRSSVR